ncbi:glycoside hydrolase family 5 protein [Tsukamurella sp. 1534]|uniref:glycoside hydrolase family 5 protein n=1 Tax=Tsukamurella sp. 1534 TaxID=1151061 RepID=UPI0002E22AB9|nr:cellulase family glycosylhydrolase [Tsukamurella sp. 1534]
MRILGRAVVVVVATAALLAASVRVPVIAPDGARSTGMRGITVATLLTQAVTISDHPDVTGTGEPQSTYDALAALGHRLIRLPVSWDYLQPNLGAGDPAVHRAYWNAIVAEVRKIGAAGLRAVLDLHNGCEWTKPRSTAPPLVCGAGITTSMTDDVWKRLSDEFKDDPAVVAYDLFNEPTRFDHPTRADLRKPGQPPYSAYKRHVDEVVRTIRANGDGKDIWVESLCCSVYSDFAVTDPGGGWVNDPLNRIVYSQHMYPVKNSAVGEPFDPAKADPDYVRDGDRSWVDRGYVRGFLGRLDDFGRWCAENGVRCSVGEVGWFGEGQSAESAAQWNALGDRWYAIANGYGMAVTYYGASSAFHGPLWAYDAPGPDAWFPAPGLTRKQPQATVIERPENRTP